MQHLIVQTGQAHASFIPQRDKIDIGIGINTARQIANRLFDRFTIFFLCSLNQVGIESGEQAGFVVSGVNHGFVDRFIFLKSCITNIGIVNGRNHLQYLHDFGGFHFADDSGISLDIVGSRKQRVV